MHEKMVAIHETLPFTYYEKRYKMGPS